MAHTMPKTIQQATQSASIIAHTIIQRRYPKTSQPSPPTINAKKVAVARAIVRVGISRNRMRLKRKQNDSCHATTAAPIAIQRSVDQKSPFNIITS